MKIVTIVTCKNTNLTDNLRSIFKTSPSNLYGRVQIQEGGFNDLFGASAPYKGFSEQVSKRIPELGLSSTATYLAYSHWLKDKPATTEIWAFPGGRSVLVTSNLEAGAEIAGVPDLGVSSFKTALKISAQKEEDKMGTMTDSIYLSKVKIDEEISALLQGVFNLNKQFRELVDFISKYAPDQAQTILKIYIDWGIQKEKTEKELKDLMK